MLRTVIILGVNVAYSYYIRSKCCAPLLGINVAPRYYIKYICCIHLLNHMRFSFYFCLISDINMTHLSWLLCRVHAIELCCYRHSQS